MSDKSFKFKQAVKQMILNLPDWAQDQQILLISGQECIVEYNPVERKIKIKLIRCNYCGDCCLDFPPTKFGCDDEGRCLMLERNLRGEWKCQARIDKPYRCLMDISKINSPNCVIEHDIIDV